MKELIEAMKAWPIIVQGALGSALFWVILVFAQKSFDFCSKLYSTHSASSRKSFLISKFVKLNAFITGNQFDISAVMYRSLRFLYKSLMWLALGFIFENLFSIGGVIGFVGCFYYLSKAYQLVSPLDEDINKSLEERDKVKEELKTMGVVDIK